jgi:hypothetical protein
VEDGAGAEGGIGAMIGVGGEMCGRMGCVIKRSWGIGGILVGEFVVRMRGFGVYCL